MLKRLLLIFFLFISIAGNAQPLKFNYQGVARDSAGYGLDTRTISMRITIHDSTATGPTQYSETQITTTNSFGLFNVQIGAGSVVSGSMNDITWANGDKFIQVELDSNGGIDFVDLGASQLLSVPYAIYSGASSDECVSHQDSTIKIGCNSLISDGSIVIGYNTRDSSNRSIVIGNRAVTPTGPPGSTYGHTVIGNDIDISSSTDMGTVAIGYNTKALSTGISGIHGGTTLVGTQNYGSGTTLGYRDTAMLYENIVIGDQSASLGTIGAGPVFIIADRGKSFPSLSNAGGGTVGTHVLIGDIPWASGYINYLIGGGCGIGHDFVSCWACSGIDQGYTRDVSTNHHQAYLGWYDDASSDFSEGQGLYNDWFIGGPDSATTPHPITMSIPSARTNINAPGADWTLRGSRATGTGISGEIAFQTGDVTTSGNAQQPWTEKFRVRAGKNLGGVLVSGRTDMVGGTIPASTGRVLNVTATLNGANNGDEKAVQIDINGNGNVAAGQEALRVNLNAGYTGSKTTVASESDNKTAGTGTALLMGTSLANANANTAVSGFTYGVTVGTNVGATNEAANGNINVGSLSKAVTKKSNALNIGSAAVAYSSVTTDSVIGAYISLDTFQSHLVGQTSTALLVNNGLFARPIARFQDNNTDAFVIEDGGTQLTWKSLKLLQGTGSPEGVVAANTGSMYLRTDGGATSTLYIKESGTGNTGWVGDLTSSPSQTFTSTLPGAYMADEKGVFMNITGSGNVAAAQTALKVRLNSGYTGTKISAGMEVDNNSAGIGNSLLMGSSLLNPNANSGLNSFAYGVTQGANISSVNEAANGNINVGTMSKAVTKKGNAVNIGSASIAYSANTSDTVIGAYISLDTFQSHLVDQTSTALLVNNGLFARPIAKFQDNNTDVFVIEDGGAQMTWKTLKLLQGSNSPESSLSANVGSLYLRTNGASSSTLYIKESGTGSTGWASPLTYSPTQTLNISPILPGATNIDEKGIFMNITGSGSTATAQTGVKVKLSAGYTGNRVAVGMEVDNNTASTGTSLLMGKSTSNPYANIGLSSFAYGTTAGANVGVVNEAANGNINIGTLSKSVTAKGGNLNIGSATIAYSKDTTDTIIGAYITLDTSQSHLTNQSSTALLVSNGALARPIARFQDNNTDVYVIEDGGAQVTWKSLKLLQGAGTPEGNVIANVGSMYLRTDGGSSSTLYIKESGTGSTGWVGK
jgi:hypothetical protein